MTDMTQQIRKKPQENISLLLFLKQYESHYKSFLEKQKEISHGLFQCVLKGELTPRKHTCSNDGCVQRNSHRHNEAQENRKLHWLRAI